MHSRLSLVLSAAILLIASVVVAQVRSGRPGVRVVELPTVAQVGTSVDKLMLLDAQGLTLNTVLVPERHVHNAPPSAGYVTLQALSGSGEVLVSGGVERIDPRHLIVLAPGTRFDVRCGSGTELVLLVHELPPTRANR
jgi:hypothetical protein